MSACLALEQHAARRLPGPGGHVLARGGRQAFRRVRRHAALRDDRRSVPGGGERTDRLCRRAGRELDRGGGRAHARSHVPDAAVHLRRDPAADPPEPAVDGGRGGRGDRGSIRTRSRWRSARSGWAAICPMPPAWRWRATPRRRGWRRPSPGSAAIAGENAAAIYGLNVARVAHRGRAQQYDALLGAGPQPRAALRTRRDFAGDVGAQPARAPCTRCWSRSPRHGVSMTRLESRPGAHGPVGIPLLCRPRRARNRADGCGGAGRTWKKSAYAQDIGIVSCSSLLGVS